MITKSFAGRCPCCYEPVQVKYAFAGESVIIYDNEGLDTGTRIMENRWSLLDKHYPVCRPCLPLWDELKREKSGTRMSTRRFPE